MWHFPNNGDVLQRDFAAKTCLVEFKSPFQTLPLADPIQGFQSHRIMFDKYVVFWGQGMGGMKMRNSDGFLWESNRGVLHESVNFI